MISDIQAKPPEVNTHVTRKEFERLRVHWTILTSDWHNTSLFCRIDAPRMDNKAEIYVTGGVYVRLLAVIYMGQLIIKKTRKKFARRFVQAHIVILFIFTLWGVCSFVVTDRPTEDNIEWGVFIITLCLSWSLLVCLLTVYHNEKKTITKLEIDDEGNLVIEYTDFDRMERFVTSLDKLDVTLKRSYWQGASRLNIDFWIGKNKKLLRQHINTVWNGHDVKETFLMIKIYKNSKLNKREKDIVVDEEFS